MASTLRGLWGFPLTPFVGGAVDVAALAALVAVQVRSVDVLCACGVIAEVESLSFDEWATCAATVIANSAQLPVVVTVPLWADAAAAAAKAQDMGASALLVLPRSPVVAECRRLLETVALAAPALPLVLYHKPPLRLAVEDLAPLCEVALFAGLKDGHRDIRLYRRLRESVGERLLWLSAFEDVAPAFWAVGCDAFSPASATYAPAYARMWLNALLRGNVAEARRLLSAHGYPLTDLRLQRPNIDVSVVKAISAALGLPLTEETRPPAERLTDEERDKIAALTATLKDLIRH